VDVLDGKVIRWLVLARVRDRDVVAARNCLPARRETDRARATDEQDAHV